MMPVLGFKGWLIWDEDGPVLGDDGVPIAFGTEESAWRWINAG